MRMSLIVSFLLATQWGAPAVAESAREMLASGHADEAIRVLHQPNPSDLKRAEADNLLCRAYFELEQWDAAVSACEKAASLDSSSSLFQLWLGRAYGEKADRVSFLKAASLAGKVRDSFERAVQLDPGSWEARTDLAEFYLEAPSLVGGGKDKAQAQADALMRIKPGLAHWVMGRLAEKNKDGAAAEREYRAAIESSGDGAHAWLNLALFYWHTKRFDEMEKTLHSMELRPQDRPESLSDGASILLRSGRNFPFAIRLVQKYLQGPLVEQEPAFKAHELLGELLEKQGDRKGAADQYRAALTLASEYGRARSGLKRVEP